MVGKMKKNKRELSPQFINTTILGFQPNITIASFVPKNIMISTLHYDDNIDEKTCKPETILFYNQTKDGIDEVDGISGAFWTPPYHFCYDSPPHQRRVN
jgi:hypothetical protein